MTGTTEIPHSLSEDIQALLVAPLFVAFAVLLFRQAGLLTGGTVGLAFLIHYAGGWPMGAVVFAINLPFYVFAVRALGWEFAVKTFVAVSLLAIYTETLLTICIPDYAELDKRRAEQEKEVGAIKKRLAGKQQSLDACMAAGEVRNYLAAAKRIHDGGITLNEAQAAQWRQMTQKVAGPLAEIQALRQEIEKLEATLAAPNGQLAEIDAQREQAGTGIGCEVSQVVGEVAVHTAAIAPGAAVFGAIETAKLKQALRDTRIVRQRLFRATTGSFSWSWKPPAAT